MIASQLVSIAQDLQQEYERFGLVDLLQSAIQISSDRPNVNNSTYRDITGSLKDRARAVLEQSVFRTYPLDTLKLLSNSEISSILPSTIANMIIGGFPNRKESAISSAELNMYLVEVKSILNQIAGFLNFNERLGVEKYEIPNEKVGLAIKIPRKIFSNQVISFQSRLLVFSSFFRSVTELVTGSREDPELVYLSTTDPTTVVAVAGTAAMGILTFYKLILEIAEKHISLRKAWDELKNSKLPESSLSEIEKGIQAGLETSNNEAIDKAFKAVELKVSADRSKELRVEIGRQALELTLDISKGARIFVSLESQQQIELMANEALDDTTEIKLHIEEQKLLEARLDNLTSELSTPRAELSYIAPPK
ncbi:hypothetical protein I8G32_03073 [Rhodopseudomonas palustris]|uniref:Uncharacterized protein n=1 Tax=Rhodopseudomonas palustris (strain ATCC BAA-98 / CGA009) TaxID=258594 RepID=Q6N5J6_RHOPA|nr:hypothetical protein [Rhodopseudomonas palustris]QQM04515.1 hypothetical protein I8G32_03073 [Rhodopseudomonas palustris]WAB75899.1 hypothetical protein OR798_15450 [Rhodopseudomonas palustris]WCL93150.1 hypothetical protein TX73_015445 [Rhodopseudomonas palustris CGA009]WND49808.1 hypothetical protein L1A21_15380 [Rhodopseudomonas palustris]CAE28419.1 unknown protein [Rhodopseudomonas palustris CGA009]